MSDYDFHKNHFELLGLPPRFHLDSARLDQAYREIQAQVHPDRVAHLGAVERRVSMQWATAANEAYQTLRDPLARARYLLHLRHVDTQEETNTAMPTAFLMEQMEYREAIAEAKASHDAHALERLEGQLKEKIVHHLAELERALDQAHDDAAAASLVRSLRFLNKIAAEIADALDALEQ
ncbi:MAG: Fe-S protein assembly co-chaperone HscB [Betaproteobacteria bacterium]|nr:Fe-S protein assembly co-chaperone HscB [Betaproteobacteria bacterium]